MVGAGVVKVTEVVQDEAEVDMAIAGVGVVGAELGLVDG